MDVEPLRTLDAGVSEHDRSKLKIRLVLAATLLIGSLLALANMRLPVARNALAYTKAALELSRHHFHLLEFARDPMLNTGKPIAFALIAAPFTRLFDASASVVIASTLGTAFFVWMSALVLGRLLRGTNDDGRARSLALVITVSNPLVFYQFWSGYPDSLLAGLVLLAWLLTDTIATQPQRDTRWQIIALGGVIALAIHTKLYGAILGLLCPLYLLCYAPTLLRRSSFLRSKLVLLCCVFTILGMLLIGTKLEMYPFLHLGENAGYSETQFAGIRELAQVIGMSSMTLLVVLLLNFHFALAGLASLNATRVFSAPQMIFIGLYTLGFFSFIGTFLNMRYFVPAFPFIAAVAAPGLLSFDGSTRRMLIGAYSVMALVLTLTFNVAPIERMLSPLIGRVYDWQPTSRLDNLRLPMQLELRKQIQSVNSQVPPGSTLYWSSNYYETTTHGLAQELGVKAGLDVRYVLYTSAVPRSPVPVFLVNFTSLLPEDALADAPSWSIANRLASGVFRLDPFFLECEASPCESVSATQPVPLRLRANVSTLREDTIQITEVDRIVAQPRNSSLDWRWTAHSAGRHELIARATTRDGREAVSLPFVVYAEVPAFERAITSIEDVALERPNGSVIPLYLSARYYGYDPFARPVVPQGSIIGLRFSGVSVPAGTRVARAYAQIPSLHGATFEFEISGELAKGDRTFVWGQKNLSTRSRTAARMRWRAQTPTSIEAPRSPDLAAILNEVLSRPEWTPRSSLVLLLHLVEDVPASVENDASGRPTLLIELEDPHT